MSPYTYTADNSVMLTDPDGLAVEDIYIDKDGNYLGTDGDKSKKIRVIDRKKWNEVNNSVGTKSKEGAKEL